MKKQTMVLALAIVLIVSATACNGNTPREESSMISAASAAESDAPESAQEPSDTGNEVITASGDLVFPMGDPVSLPDYFIGNAWLFPLIPNEEVYNSPTMSNVTFEPEARNNWHSHEGGQILLVTGGVGYYQAEGQPAQIIREGDVVMIEPGVKHWHGATSDSWFSHIAIATNPDKPGVEWMEAVTEGEYGTLEPEEFSSRESGGENTDTDPSSDFIFPRGDIFDSEYFTGTVYLSPIVGRDEIFNCPTMSNVTFEPGVRNNWHIHEGGQIMIATNGIGYHQIEGQPVEILHPGDVAMCPPGAKHWHGASAGSWFAHIAVGINPDMRGMEWLEPVTDEEYSNLPTE